MTVQMIDDQKSEYMMALFKGSSDGAQDYLFSLPFHCECYLLLFFSICLLDSPPPLFRFCFLFALFYCVCFHCIYSVVDWKPWRFSFMCSNNVAARSARRMFVVGFEPGHKWIFSPTSFQLTLFWITQTFIYMVSIRMCNNEHYATHIPDTQQVHPFASNTLYSAINSILKIYMHITQASTWLIKIRNIVWRTGFSVENGRTSWNKIVKWPNEIKRKWTGA